MRFTAAGAISPVCPLPGIRFSSTPWAKPWLISGLQNKKGTPVGVPYFHLAAGALAAVATQICAVGVVAAAAAAEQNDQDDNPPNVAAGTVAVTHNRYLRNIIS